MLGTIIVAIVAACADAAVAPKTWTLTKLGDPAGAVVGKAASPAPTVRLTVNGEPQAGETINWSSTAGTLGGASSVTDADGKASIVWTLGTTPGTQTLTGAGPSGVSSVQFAATVVADRPAIVRFSPDSVILDALGDSVRLTPTVTDQYSNPTPVATTYAVDSSRIATVTAGGYTKSSANGRARVIASADTARGALRVIVRQAVSAVELTPRAPATMASIGDTVTLTFRANDRMGAQIADAIPLYASRDTAVIGVDLVGRVTARKNGSTYVRVTVAGATAKDSVPVTVLQVVQSVVASPDTVAISFGDSLQLAASVQDARGVPATGTVSWLSRDTNVVRVTAAGMAKAVKDTGATVWAIAAFNSAKDSIAVVVGRIPVASVLITPDSVSRIAGDTVRLAGAVRNAANQPLTGRATAWTSLFPAIATVSTTGLVTAVADGRGLIVFTSEGKSDTAVVRVTERVSAVGINPPTASIGTGATRQLAAYPLSPVGDTLAGRSIAWSSSNTAVATVSPTGLVSGVAIGTVVITAQSEGKSANAMIRVTASVASVSVLQGGVTIPRGGRHQMTASTRDLSGTVLSDRELIWSSSNSGVAAVNSTGIVTGVAAGSATITATSEGRSGSTTISVSNNQVAAASITAGSKHACGLTVGGVAYCWGDAKYTGHGSYATDFTARYAATPVAGGHLFKSIVATEQGTLALTTSGAAYAWGTSGWGQFGDGTVSFIVRDTPAPVSGGLVFSAIAASSYHACGIATTGAAYCWGRNQYGQLGDGTNVDRSVPTLVSGGLTFDRISVGAEHTVALTPAGVAYAWGYNGGALGDGTLTHRNVPVLVSGGRTFAQIAASYGTLALTSAGKIFSWPYTPTRNDLVPVEIPSTETFVTISKGAASMALTTSGALFVWGNRLGGLPSVVPVHDTFPTPFAVGRTFTAIAAGNWNGLTLGADGRGAGWGNGTVIGDARTENSETLQDVTPGAVVVTLPSATTSVMRGGRVDVTVTVTPIGGGFTATGPVPFTGEVTLGAENLPAGVTATFSPVTVGAGRATSTMTIVADATVAAQSRNISVRATGADLRHGTYLQSMPLSVTTPPAPDGTLNLECPTGSTDLGVSGYHCMSFDGAHVPGQYAGRPGLTAMHGTWVDDGAGVCINWGADGKATGRFKGGLGGGPSTTASGEWGVIVRRSGVPEGSESMWYVFTEKLDAQTRLLSFDSVNNRVINWNFTKRACPW